MSLNCRILPGVAPASVQRAIVDVLDDPGIDVAAVDTANPSPASPLTPQVMEPLQALVEEFFPQAVIIPQMSTGATDGLYVRNAGIPVYGTAAIFDTPDDVRAHGRDERVPVESFHEATEFWYRLAKAYASP